MENMNESNRREEELLKIISNNPVTEFDFSYKIAREILLKMEERDVLDPYIIGGTIYQAGVIEGIKQERMRNSIKAKKTSNEIEKLKRENERLKILIANILDEIVVSWLWLLITKKWRDEQIKEGILQPVKGLPVIRFNPHYIAELEGTKLEKLSPHERRRLEREIERLKIENEKLRKALLTVLSITSEATNFITEKEDLYY